MFLEGLDQMIRIFFSGIFDAKVVDEKGESDGTRRILPEGRDVGDRRISQLGGLICLRPGMLFRISM